MIARIWHGVTRESDAEEYLQYLMKTGIPGYQATEGNRGVYVLRRVSNGHADFLLISLWESEDAIRKFAGRDMDQARYFPEDKEFLPALEPNVTHYDVLVKP